MRRRRLGRGRLRGGGLRRRSRRRARGGVHLLGHRLLLGRRLGGLRGRRVAVEDACVALFCTWALLATLVTALTLLPVAVATAAATDSTLVLVAWATAAAMVAWACTLWPPDAVCAAVWATEEATSFAWLGTVAETAAAIEAAD